MKNNSSASEKKREENQFAAGLPANRIYSKEKLFEPDLESVGFQTLKFTEFLIGRVLFFEENCKLIFSFFFSSGGLFVTFWAAAKS